MGGVKYHFQYNTPKNVDYYSLKVIKHKVSKRLWIRKNEIKFLDSFIFKSFLTLKTTKIMKKLSIEKMENLSGGCSFDEMAFYATSALYHIGQLSSSSQYWYYHSAGIGYYNARLIACM